MPTNAPRKFDLVGLADIPPMLGIARQTARQWRSRGILPEEQAVVSGTPAWERSTIIDWALETRRIDRGRATELRAAARAEQVAVDA